MNFPYILQDSLKEAFLQGSACHRRLAPERSALSTKEILVVSVRLDSALTMVFRLIERIRYQTTKLGTRAGDFEPAWLDHLRSTAMAVGIADMRYAINPDDQNLADDRNRAYTLFMRDCGTLQRWIRTVFGVEAYRVLPEWLRQLALSSGDSNYKSPQQVLTAA